MFKSTSKGYKSETNKSSDKHSKQSYVATNSNCVQCGESHALYRCKAFENSSHTQRIELVKKNNLCFNCLSRGHTVVQCQSQSRCRSCNKRHHTLIHKEHRTPGAENTAHSQSFCSLQVKQQSQVLLSTAMVKVRDSKGVLQPCRVLLDTGSQTNFISEDCVQRLRLRKIRHSIPLQGFNGLSSHSKFMVETEVHSMVSPYHINVNCAILPKITTDLPANYIEYRDWGLPNDIKLADPQFNVPQKIDMLLGAQIFMKILKMHQRTKKGNYPILQDTQFGWILSGEYLNTSEVPVQHTQQSLFARNDQELSQSLQRFWEIEEIDRPVRSKEEIECENHFTTHFTRNDSGRFVVKLPFKDDPRSLGDSKQMAYKRLSHIEKRLEQDASLREEYNNFMTEYETSGHMKRIEESQDTTEPNYYLPHHPVFKESSTTTKTRVVFDASCKTTTNKSLNDILRVGPTLQQDLYSIMIRFRTHPVAFIADIKQMYRQVSVHEDDQRFQRIIWRNSPQEPVQQYQLTTVTYGTAPAPYLATRCLLQLAQEECQQFPQAAELLRQDFYVDDLISGASSVPSGIHLQQQVQELLNHGGFHLRKWSTNNKELLSNIPLELRESQHSLQINDTEIVKTLGVFWDPNKDQFQIVSANGQHASSKPLTKRVVLSIISSIFDPLGLISPIVIISKIFMQRIWQRSLQWDEVLPDDLMKQWETYHHNLASVTNISIDRLVTSKETSVDIQLHGYADASEQAYGACLYLRCIDSSGKITVNLLCSKSRVAPLKRVTLPRLELCATHLLSKLVRKSLSILRLKLNNVNLWTDSTVALAWISSCPSRWKTFVANRVAEIQDNTPTAVWNHVASEHNPADLISRGISPDQLLENALWWHGPTWLCLPTTEWPQHSSPPLKKVPEERKDTAVCSLLETTVQNTLLNKYSTLQRLLRITAYCLRFIDRLKKSRRAYASIHLTTAELDESLKTCIRMTQRIEYAVELSLLQKGKELPKDNSLAKLTPFIDQDNILRVGGRLQNSTLSDDSKHPIILPTNHQFTLLVVRDEHHRLLHAGLQLLMSSVRQRYWIIRMKQLAKSVIHKCIRCFKLKACTANQRMGNLPAYRVTPCRAFINVGVDYAGPLTIKIGSIRSKGTTKAYVAVFVCMSTKAVHLELVSSLTSSAFIAALHRFVSRRGLCQHIYSDNGTNFVGANKELQQFFKIEQDKGDIANHLTSQGCQWHFIPPNSPHFGGLWEAAVRSMKHHLQRVAGNSVFNFEELTTLLARIEACLNSRPLVPLTTDNDEFSYLTPGHFLVHHPLTSLPEPDFSGANVHRLTRWQRIVQATQHIWDRWSNEYLHTLQQRHKWSSKSNNIQLNQLVLVKESNLPPLQWRVAVVTETHPGADGLVRVVTIKTANGTYKRPIHKLCPFPQDDDKTSVPHGGRNIL